MSVRIPRTRGDEPENQQKMMAAFKNVFPAPAGMNRYALLEVLIEICVFPAPAGMNRSEKFSRLRERPYSPHPRG